MDPSAWIFEYFRWSFETLRGATMSDYAKVGAIFFGLWLYWVVLSISLSTGKSKHKILVRIIRTSFRSHKEK